MSISFDISSSNSLSSFSVLLVKIKSVDKLLVCQVLNITDSAYPYPASTSSWANHTWYFSDGGSSSSLILNRTDAEYLKYISQVEAACKTIPQSKFFWKAGAGNNSSSNWQNFGIPDCSGTVQPEQPAYQTAYPTAPTYPTTAYTSSDSECSSLQDILSGCHLMSENSNVRFNGAMDQYVQVGTRTIKYCSTNFVPGCASYYPSDSTYCPSPSYWDPAINGCAPGAATTAPISPPSPVCATPSDFGICNYGYEYNSNGCAIGCRATLPSPSPTGPLPPTTVEPPPPPPSEPLPPPPAANVWKAIKLLFGF